MKSASTVAWKMIGMLLALIGGLVATGTAVYISHDGVYLWSLILVAITLAPAAYADFSSFMCVVIGLTTGVLSTCVAAAIYYLGAPNCIWALVLVAAVMSPFVDVG
jgi:hypothetical protein